MEIPELNKIFKIISFYDKIRWSSASKNDFINYYKDGLDVDAKLLTHWLCYITDRQMAFKRIWDVGGFVLSELVDEYIGKKDLDSLLNPNNEDSFFKKKEKKNSEDGYVFRSKSKVGDNDKLKDSYNLKMEDFVEFTPRFYASDYMSIFFTLDVLKDYEYSLSKYIAKQINRFKDNKDMISRVLFSLYLLTYSDIGRLGKNNLLTFDKNEDESEEHKSEEHKKNLKRILYKDFEIEFDKFKKDTIFHQKRAWCSLRDFFKPGVFNDYFKETLKRENVNFEELFSLKYYQQFELPGDVWNNNSKFRKCILEKTEYNDSKMSLNKILRDYFDKNKGDLGDSYPEQFDITFDFVPRMCENNNCDICPIGLIKGNIESQFEKTCVKNKEKYCPVAMIGCNYKKECFGDDCELLRILYPQNQFK